jgi:class 3 adenylate cyclase
MDGESDLIGRLVELRVSGLKRSTRLYDRVGDLAAFDLRAHFRVPNDIVASEAGAIVKTIGDAVMATFPTPDRAIAAALRMREAVERLGGEHGEPDLLLKIGIHEGPFLAVALNERQDYFGQTVNVASRVQELTASRAIYATKPVVDYPQSLSVLEGSGITPVAGRRELAGVTDEVAVYETPPEASPGPNSSPAGRRRWRGGSSSGTSAAPPPWCSR